MKRINAVLICTAVLPLMSAMSVSAQYWLEPMKKVNESFDGNPGYVAQFGDSITNSNAFWSIVDWTYPDKFISGEGKDGADGLPKVPEGKRWRDIIKGAKGKGPENGNQSGWRIAQLLPAVETVLARENPEAAIIMIGTNDIGGLKGVPKEYEAGLRKIIDKCIVAHCIPILNTIPPRRNHMEAVAAVNEVVKKLAMEYKIPLVDYCGEILRRHPEDWDGTLIDKDGVHPSNPSKQSADLSEANINSNGYPLRTWMNFMMFREVYLKIMSAPKPFSELIGNVEEIGNGIICPVTADTEVSYYLDASDNERIWNWGKSEKIKFKGYEEFLLLDFDTSKVPRKSKIKKATLYLGRTENCVIPVVGVTTISSPWAEGTGRGWDSNKPDLAEQGAQSKGGATLDYAVYPDKRWIPGNEKSNFKCVTFSEGGSIYGYVNSGWAKGKDANSKTPEYSSVELPADIAQAIMVDGDTWGIALSEEKGQRAYCKGYRKVPNPNHFVYSRESSRPPFLLVETDGTDTVAPSAVTEISARPGTEAGGMVLDWKCPGDDGSSEGRALGYFVHLSTDRLDEKSLTQENLLPRSRTYRPMEAGKKQTFWIDDLKPGTEYNFAVIAYDKAGNKSPAAFIKGKTREAKNVELKPFASIIEKGAPAENKDMKVWASPSNSVVNPQTGAELDAGNYKGQLSAGGYQDGNEVWNGKMKEIVLFAGSNDFTGFQIHVMNKTLSELNGIELKLSDLMESGSVSATAKLIVMSSENPSGFQAEMAKLMEQDRKLAEAVFSDVKKLNELKKKQTENPMEFFVEMEAVKKNDKAAYDRWMFLIGGGKGGAAGKGIPACSSEIFWLWSLKDKEGLWYPDAMIPFTDSVGIPSASNKIEGQRLQSFYMDIFVPHKTKPGLYTGTLDIGTPESPITVPVKLTVWNYELPDELTFFSEMNGYNYPQFNKDSMNEGVFNLHRLAHRNRLNTNILPYSHNGNWTVPQFEPLSAEGTGKNIVIGNLNAIDKSFGPLLNGTAFKNNPRKNVPVTGFYLPLYEQWPCDLSKGYKLDQQADSLDIRKDFSSDYRIGWQKAAADIGKFIKDKGWSKPLFQLYLNNKYIMSETVFWCLDEPVYRDDFLCLEMFNDMTRIAFSQLSTDIKVNFRVDLSRIEESKDMLDKTDLLVMAQANIREFPTIVRDHFRNYIRNSDGKAQKLWVYGGTSKISDSNTSNRGFSIASYFLDANGVVPWLAIGTEKSWDTAEDAENAVFYPAWDRWEHNGCYGSLRMKSFRDGQQDAEYLNLLLAKLDVTRTDLKPSISKVVSIEGTVKKANELDAGRVSFKDMTPDKLELLRRSIGYNIDIANGGK